MNFDLGQMMLLLLRPCLRTSHTSCIFSRHLSLLRSSMGSELIPANWPHDRWSPSQPCILHGPHQNTQTFPKKSNLPKKDHSTHALLPPVAFSSVLFPSTLFVLILPIIPSTSAITDMTPTIVTKTCTTKTQTSASHLSSTVHPLFPSVQESTTCLYVIWSEPQSVRARAMERQLKPRGKTK